MLIHDLTPWNVVPWGIAALWLVYLTLLVSGLRRRQVLSAATPVTLPRGTPRLTVVIAARNEESCIETCLRSLLQQDYPNLEIIAINDRSTDSTGAIMSRLEVEYLGQLRAVRRCLSQYTHKPKSEIENVRNTLME